MAGCWPCGAKAKSVRPEQYTDLTAEERRLEGAITDTDLTGSQMEEQELLSVQRKLASYQSLGVVSALLFGFSATVLFEISTDAEVDENKALGYAVMLSLIATTLGLLSTFIYIYHGYHGDSLLSMRGEGGRPMVYRAAPLAYKFIDVTRYQRYIASAAQLSSAFCLLGSLSVTVYVSPHIVVHNLGWPSSAVAMLGFFVTVLLISHANHLRHRTKAQARKILEEAAINRQQNARSP